MDFHCLCVSLKTKQTNQRNALPNQFTSLLLLSFLSYSNRRMASTFQSRLLSTSMLHLLLPLLSSRKSPGMVEQADCCICGCTMSCSATPCLSKGQRGQRMKKQAEIAKCCLLAFALILLPPEYRESRKKKRQIHALEIYTHFECFLLFFTVFNSFSFRTRQPGFASQHNVICVKMVPLTSFLFSLYL